MTLIDRLISNAPGAEDPAPDLPEPLTRADARLSALARPDSPDTLEGPGPDGALDLEPVFTVIDYCDATGNETRRRITLRSLRIGPEAPVLQAICHERKALRLFRCDRIDGFIEPDGEVLTPVAFFRELMGVDLGGFTHSSDLGKARTSAGQIIDVLRPELALLAAAARCDNEFHIEELDAIQRYAEREALNLERHEQLAEPLTIDTLNMMGVLIAKLRPPRTAIRGYLESIAQLPHSTQVRLFRALNEVIAADGKFVADEKEFLAEVGAIAGSRENGS